MARWKLATAHYLNMIDASEWEYSETDRTTGRPRKRVFKVPTLLDPQDPTLWNSRAGEEGEIIVCDHGTHESRDYEFVGDPTADMIPLDDEAKAISAKFEAKWNRPAEGLGADSYGESLIIGFQKQLAEVQSTTKSTEISGMSELLAAMTSMIKQNQDLIAVLTKSQPQTERRV